MSSNFPTCAGCFVNPAWPGPNWNPIWNNPLPPSPNYAPTLAPLFSFLPPPDYGQLGLTSEEQLVLKHLADAFSTFVGLSDKHPDDDTEFRCAIHEAQRAVAIRVARRIDPHVWTQPQSAPEQEAPQE